jgi:hypothetical protein
MRYSLAIKGISLCDNPRIARVDAWAPKPLRWNLTFPTFAMATIDEDLSQIEKDIRTLKIEYEQFFGGGRSRPPADTQWRAESLIRRYAERAGDLSSGQRFRYNNLTQTYAKYQEMWRKKLMQKEGAVTQHHFGAAAKAIEAERARQAARRDSQAPPAPVAAPPTHAAALAEAAAEVARATVQENHSSHAFAMSFSDPEHENEKVKKLYKKLIDARAEAGDKAAGPSLKDFEQFVRQKTKDLIDKGGHEIEYTVTVEAGRVKLKARISN